MQRCPNDECNYVFLPKYLSCPKCGTSMPTEFGNLIDKLMKMHSQSARERLLEEAGIDAPDKLFSFLKNIKK
jgi:hypothetical protein